MKHETQFSTRPFAAGSVIGLRAFTVGIDGTLHGYIHRTPFRPGVNAAQCMVMASPLVRLFLGARRVEGPVEHVVGNLDCTCGFYAYTTGVNEYRRDDPGATVPAIVEGYGVCTIGARGFRASKARLVALIDPVTDPVKLQLWQRVAMVADHKIFGRVPLTLLTGAVLMRAIQEFAQGEILHGLAATAIAAGAFLCGACLVSLGSTLNFQRRNKVRQFNPDRVNFAAVRAMYPDVPVYATTAEAVAAHPLGPVLS